MPIIELNAVAKQPIPVDPSWEMFSGTPAQLHARYMEGALIQYSDPSSWDASGWGNLSPRDMRSLEWFAIKIHSGHKFRISKKDKYVIGRPFTYLIGTQRFLATAIGTNVTHMEQSAMQSDGVEWVGSSVTIKIPIATNV